MHKLDVKYLNALDSRDAAAWVCNTYSNAPATLKFDTILISCYDFSLWFKHHFGMYWFIKAVLINISILKNNV